MRQQGAYSPDYTSGPSPSYSPGYGSGSDAGSPQYSPTSGAGSDDGAVFSEEEEEEQPQVHPLHSLILHKRSSGCGRSVQRISEPD